VEEVKAKVKVFLDKNDMNPAHIDMEKTCQIFLKEMERGLAAEQSSLAMLPTYIETERRIPLNKPVIVMDAGGTNFRVATVSFDQDGNSNIENFKLFPMPGVKQQVSKDEFFNTMAEYLDEVIDKSANIGFFFFFKQKTAYEIMPSLVGSEMCIRDRPGPC